MYRILTSTKVWTVVTWSILGLYDCLGSIKVVHMFLEYRLQMGVTVLFLARL